MSEETAPEKPAEWLPNPIFERDLQEGERQRVRMRRVAWAFGITALIGCPISCLSIVGEGGGPILILPALILGFTFLAHHRSEKYRRFRVSRYTALAAEFGAVKGWIVNLSVYQGAALTGQDQGVVWFEEDQLYFSGYRTSLGLVARSTSGVLSEHWSVDGLRSALMLELDTLCPVGKVHLGFDVLAPDATNNLQQNIQDSLARPLRGWMTNRGPADSQRPPLDLGPGLPTRPVLLCRAVVSTLFWILSLTGIGLLAAASGWESTFFPLFALGIFAALAPEVWIPHRRWLAYRDRCRLDRWSRQ